MKTVYTDNGAFDDFPKISDHVPKTSEKYTKLVRRLHESFRTFSENVPRLPKITEDLMEYPKLFRWYTNIYKYSLVSNMMSVK